MSQSRASYQSFGSFEQPFVRYPSNQSFIQTQTSSHLVSAQQFPQSYSLPSQTLPSTILIEHRIGESHLHSAQPSLKAQFQVSHSHRQSFQPQSHLTPTPPPPPQKQLQTSRSSSPQSHFKKPRHLNSQPRSYDKMQRQRHQSSQKQGRLRNAKARDGRGGSRRTRGQIRHRGRGRGQSRVFPVEGTSSAPPTSPHITVSEWSQKETTPARALSSTAGTHHLGVDEYGGMGEGLSSADLEALSTSLDADATLSQP